jgi:hypothetical protein
MKKSLQEVKRYGKTHNEVWIVDEASYDISKSIFKVGKVNHTI